MEDRLPPLELRQALDAATRGVSTHQLREASSRLSDAYRGASPSDRPFHATWSSVDYLAYAVSRMPATYRASEAVFQELRVRCPDLHVGRLLDLGAGPATCLWSAAAVFDELVETTLVEPDRQMLQLGQRLAEGSQVSRRVRISWQPGSVEGMTPAPRAYDLVVAAYVLGELDQSQQRVAVERAWAASRGAVALVEPGSRHGFDRIMEARRRLIDCGAQIVAPCPHHDPCPLPDGDWCHFGVRLNRTATQRRLKKGTLGYEDEKVSYVVATRAAGEPVPERVIRRPERRSGRVTLHLCGRDGLRRDTVTRSRGEAYRAARQVRWGGRWG